MRASKTLSQSVLLVVVLGCGAAGLTAQTKASRPVKVSRQQVRSDQSDLLAKGAEALQRGETQIARQIFEEALKSDPNNSSAHNYMGILSDGAGDLKNAEIHFAKAARLDPRSASLRNNYGAILLKLNRAKAAAIEFEASLRLDAKQPNALVNLAQIRFQENTPNSLQSSFRLFERAAALAPDAAIERSLVVIALRLGNKQAAAAHYQTYATLVAAKPDPPAAIDRAPLGGALFEAGLLTEAEAELKAALAAAPDNADAIVLLGRVYLARNDVKAAGVLLETAVARNRATAAVYSQLAVVYEKAGRYENAIPAMRLAINLQPESENYRFQYGILLTNADAPAAAVIRIDEALKVFPRSPRLWLARGIAFLKDDRNAEAAESISKAIELDPKFAQAHAYLGLVKLQTGEFAEAIKSYETALATDANLAIVHQLIAETMMQQTDSDAARIEAEAKKSIALAPDFTPAYLTLGKLYVRLQRWAEAAQVLKEVVRRDPETAEAYYQLGRVYARLKLKGEAEAALKRFKELSETQKARSESDLREVVRRLADVRF